MWIAWSYSFLEWCSLPCLWYCLAFSCAFLSVNSGESAILSSPEDNSGWEFMLGGIFWRPVDPANGCLQSHDHDCVNFSLLFVPMFALESGHAVDLEFVVEVIILILLCCKLVQSTMYTHYTDTIISSRYQNDGSAPIASTLGYYGKARHAPWFQYMRQVSDSPSCTLGMLFKLEKACSMSGCERHTSFLQIDTNTHLHSLSKTLRSLQLKVTRRWSDKQCCWRIRCQLFQRADI